MLAAEYVQISDIWIGIDKWIGLILTTLVYSWYLSE